MSDVVRADLVDLSLVLHHETEKAWLLSDPAAHWPEPEPQWLAKSMGERGEGRDRDVWTMPKWKARQLGFIA